ncbi:MAG: glycine betaine ABC transporter substrate-binding protein [Gemmatimonadota bacterium]
MRAGGERAGDSPVEHGPRVSSETSHPLARDAGRGWCPTAPATGSVASVIYGDPRFTRDTVTAVRDHSRRPRGRAGHPLLLALSAVSLWACGHRGEAIGVGSKNFTEQDLLGEIVAQWIEATTDLPVRRRLHLGGTFICHRALVAGEIDAYVEYTGTAYTAILERPPVPDPDSVYRAVRADYRQRWGLEWLPPLGFENTFALLVRRATADSLGLRTLSDAVPYARAWTPGFGYEFAEREDGLAGLERAYGLEFAGPPRLMDLQLTYRALAAGQVDLIAGNSTDGQIEALDLVQLRDDRGYFPPYEAAIVARGEALERHPGLRAGLEALAGRIDTREMRRLNRAVDVERLDYRQVAREWVARELSRAARGPRPRPRRRTRGSRWGTEQRPRRESPVPAHGTVADRPSRSPRDPRRPPCPCESRG